MKTPKNVFFLITIIIILFIFRYIFSVLAIHYLPQVKWSNESASQQYTIPNSVTGQKPELNLTNLWLKWDSNKYMDIAQHGYEQIPYEDTRLHNWAFYPLYPIVIGSISYLFGYTNNTQMVFLTGIIISSIFLILSLSMLKKLLYYFQLDDLKIYSIILLLLAFPSSYFFQLFYPESLFLFLSITFFYYLFKKQYLLSAVCLSLALITRPNALVLILPFFFYLAFHEYKKPLSVIISGLGYAAIIFTPLLLFFNHLYLTTGEFFASFKIQKAWNNEGFTPFGYFINYLKVYGWTIRPEHILSVILLIALITGSIISFVFFWKKRNFRYNHIESELIALFLYVFGYVFLLCSMKNLSSTFRHSGANFAFFSLPILLFNFTVKNRLLLFALIVSVITQLIFFILFLTLIPIYGF